MKLTDQQLEQLFRSLGALLHGGIPVGESLYLLAREDASLASVLEAMGRELELGATLSLAMEQAGVFPAEATGMVRIGEETGRLEEALEGLAASYDRRCQVRQQMKAALTYPVLILALSLGVLTVLLVKVLPVFDSVYASLGAGLTGPGLWLLAFGRGLKAALPYLGALAGILAALGTALWKNPGTKRKLQDFWKARWGDRGILRKFNNARFARALAMGIGSGLTLEEAMALGARLLSDIPPAAARCSEALSALEAGEDLASALEKAQLLPPARSRMLTVGLRSGSGDRVMEQIAGRLESDADEALARQAGKIEPAMVLLCTGLLGLILLSVMLPLVEILSALG